MNIPSRLALAALASLAVLAGANDASAARGSRGMHLAGPISVPAGVSLKEVEASIKTGLMRRDWKVTKDKPGLIEATLDVRQHHLVENIHYSKSEITFEYVDSRELGYREENGEKLIHPKVTEWNNAVEREINSELSHRASH